MPDTTGQDSYTVTVEAYVENAPDFDDAAKEGWAILTDPSAMDPIVTVKNNRTGEEVTIDLEPVMGGVALPSYLTNPTDPNHKLYVPPDKRIG